MKHIPISEIFGPTLQGEGPLIGKPSVFVRVGGCDYRCNWCDTLYAVLPEYKHEWTKVSEDEILSKVLSLTNRNPILVTLTGGNPALYNFSGLLKKGHAHGLTFALETQGSIAKPWFAVLDHLIVSPKGPTSGMKTDWNIVGECLSYNIPSVLKIVVFDEEDYLFARHGAVLFPEAPIYLQLGTSNDESKSTLGEQAEWLLKKVIDDNWQNVTILPQMHVMLWGKKRGV
ncbi:MAG: 7-carboxy-7-deazaguanine synthase QueE [Abditibacteriaceae bacterium]